MLYVEGKQMISMMTFCSELQELMRIKNNSKKHVAVLSEDKWVMDFYDKIEEFKIKIKENPQLDIICYELEPEHGISYASYIRKCYEQAYLILIADANISPIEYIKPDILPTGLIITPATNEDVSKVLWNVFEAFMDKINKNKLDKVYVVANREDRIIIPYSDILYFEARNKKVYIRYKNEEVGFYESMDKLEMELEDDFIRTHRGFLINKSMIRKISLSENMVMLKNDIIIPLSRRYKGELKTIKQDMKKVTNNDN